MQTENLKLSNFDYCLPKKLIAQYPCVKRDGSRLLVLDRMTAKVTHRRFKGIIDYLSAQDTLVLNNTKVIWARIIGRREKRHAKMGGGKQEIFLLEALSKSVFRVLAKPAKKLTVGTKVFFKQQPIFAEVLEDLGMTKIVKFNGQGSLDNFWQRIGSVPLPPYIKREPQQLDKERYQTVYAKETGASASPTAGLHFTKELLSAIRNQGVNIVYLTLHVNYGTFATIKSEDISKHKMHKEYFILPEKTAQIINATLAKDKRIFAVGTTSARVLESCAVKDKSGKSLFNVKPNRGWTNLFIYPPYRFKIVDAVVTNFHFPKSTLLILVTAFAGKELILRAYEEAVKRKYRFFSYGDAMLIL